MKTTRMITKITFLKSEPVRRILFQSLSAPHIDRRPDHEPQGDRSRSHHHTRSCSEFLEGQLQQENVATEILESRWINCRKLFASLLLHTNLIARKCNWSLSKLQISPKNVFCVTQKSLDFYIIFSGCQYNEAKQKKCFSLVFSNKTKKPADSTSGTENEYQRQTPMFSHKNLSFK